MEVPEYLTIVEIAIAMILGAIGLFADYRCVFRSLTSLVPVLLFARTPIFPVCIFDKH